jgi:hypothetical protein
MKVYIGKVCCFDGCDTWVSTVKVFACWATARDWVEECESDDLDEYREYREYEEMELE